MFKMIGFTSLHMFKEIFIVKLLLKRKPPGYLCECMCAFSCRTSGEIFCHSTDRGRGVCRCGSEGGLIESTTSWNTSHIACTRSSAPGYVQFDVGLNWRHVQKSCYRSRMRMALTRCVTFVREPRARAACWRICCILCTHRLHCSLPTRKCRRCCLLLSPTEIPIQEKDTWPHI